MKPAIIMKMWEHLTAKLSGLVNVVAVVSSSVTIKQPSKRQGIVLSLRMAKGKSKNEYQ
jgi:hypothetical protein